METGDFDEVENNDWIGDYVLNRYFCRCVRVTGWKQPRHVEHCFGTATDGRTDGNLTNKAIANRDPYFPGTEDLDPDEMRVTALGTGMPIARPKQAAACFLVELGNGDKFLFDIGSGSHERIAAQKRSLR